MKRNKEILIKRREFVLSYIEQNNDKQMKVIVNELANKLFLTERTIYNIIDNDI